MNPINALRRWFGAHQQNQSRGTPEAAPVSETDLRRAGEHWGERARARVQQTRPSSWAECPVVAARYMNPLISGEGEVGWLDWVLREYCTTRVARALSLGCGGGDLERHVLRLQAAQHIDAFDVSEEALELARELAAKSGQLKQINYRTANLNTLSLSERHYGVAFASQSVHHIEALEHYCSQVRRALVPGGLFIVNEFVGPNQFQWTEPQLQHAQRLLDMIPEPLRHCIREEGVRHVIERPTLEFMNGYDPTEAIRSADIVPVMEQHFDIVARRDFGGTLLHLVLDNIAGNLSFSEEGLELLQYFFNEEQRLIAAGEIDSDFTVMVARAKSEP